MLESQRRPAAVGDWLLVVFAVVALVVAGVNTFVDGNGIAYTPGTYLVLASTALMLGACLLLAFGTVLPRWLRGVLLFLILLDILGTAAASYFLYAWVLMACMAVALAAWFVRLFAGRRSVTQPGRPIGWEGMSS